MTAIAARPVVADMRPLDRLTHALRRTVERMVPWYDPDQVAQRHAETERVRQRSIAARIAVEDVAERYLRQDRVLRRR